MINLDNINKVFMCDECNSEFEIKYPEDNSKQNYLKCTSCDIQYKIVDGVIILKKVIKLKIIINRKYIRIGGQTVIKILFMIMKPQKKY